MDQREIQVPDEERERDVHQAVVQEHRAREAVARVLLAEPEEKAGDAEQDRERGGEGGVDLLAGVEPPLRRLTSAEPAQVVAVERVELPCGREHPAPAEDDDGGKRAQPGDASPEVDVLDGLPPRDEDREAGEVQDQPGCEEEEEAERVDPVEQALGPGETRDVPGPLHVPYPFERPTQAFWS